MFRVVIGIPVKRIVKGFTKTHCGWSMTAQKDAPMGRITPQGSFGRNFYPAVEQKTRDELCRQYCRNFSEENEAYENSFLL